MMNKDFTKYKKIYIIGPVSSGKTTLSKILSKKLKIKYYELDKVVWDDNRGNIKRSVLERDKMFNDILKNKTWIVEDVGRNCFRQAVKTADVVYYIDLKRFCLYYRLIRRWVRQKLNLEHYNYKPTINSLCELLQWLHKDLKNKKDKLKMLKEINKNVIILNNKEIKSMIL